MKKGLSDFVGSMGIKFELYHSYILITYVFVNANNKTSFHNMLILRCYSKLLFNNNSDVIPVVSLTFDVEMGIEVPLNLLSFKNSCATFISNYITYIIYVVRVQYEPTYLCLLSDFAILVFDTSGLGL